MPSVKHFFATRVKPKFKDPARGMPSTSFIKASEHELFTKTIPEVDGDACLHDCESCTIRYPTKFSIDNDDKLYGFVNGWSTHLVVATGKTDWVRDVADEKGSVMEAVAKCNVQPANGKLMLSASNIPLPDDYHEDESDENDLSTSILLLPAWVVVDKVRPSNVPRLIEEIIDKSPTNTSGLFEATELGTQTAICSNDSSINDLSIRTCPHKYIILLCSQKTRDARCGQSAPLLRREFERHLRPLGLYRDLHDERPDGVGIYFISHVGGHKYSANLMIYRRGDERNGANGEESRESNGQGLAANPGAAQCIWLARVRPEDCENIIRYTVLQGKVVKPESQLRGGFDRVKGLTSW